MNLRDKLKVLETPVKKTASPPPKPLFTECWHGCERRALTEFPGALSLRRETVMLMQGEDMPQSFDPRRILYLDTETTGLSGGAGTVAFEVGLGWLTDEGFEIHQYIMRDYPEERFLLERIAETAERFDVICTFNGRTFDVPLLKDRFLLNRMRTSCLDKPHIDLLHMARRVWKLRLKRCNLIHLEEAILGVPRLDDLPGALVPERYFEYLRTKDFSLLEDVLEHNAQDIASLCTLLAHMAWLYEHPEQTGHDEDVFSMGRALERFQHVEEARCCYELVSGGSLRAESQLRLAASYRRSGDREKACAIWRRMIDRREGGALPYIELAKHEEHIVRNIPAALELTRRAMLLLAEPTLLTGENPLQADVNKRYERLKRKIKEQ